MGAVLSLSRCRVLSFSVSCRPLSQYRASAFGRRPRATQHRRLLGFIAVVASSIAPSLGTGAFGLRWRTGACGGCRLSHLPLHPPSPRRCSARHSSRDPARLDLTVTVDSLWTAPPPRAVQRATPRARPRPPRPRPPRLGGRSDDERERRDDGALRASVQSRRNEARSQRARDPCGCHHSSSVHHGDAAPRTSSTTAPAPTTLPRPMTASSSFVGRARAARPPRAREACVT